MIFGCANQAGEDNRNVARMALLLAGLPDEYFVNSKEAAFTRMAARFRENTPEAAALRQLFAGDPQYQGIRDIPCSHCA